MAMVCSTVANITGYRLAVTFHPTRLFAEFALFLMERGLLMPLDAKDDFNAVRASTHRSAAR